MAYTGTTALIRGWLAPDDILWFNPRLTATIITKGDYIVASGSAVIAGESSLNGQYLRSSGWGIALANNPTYDELGVARVNTALLVAIRGVIRVSAASASALGNWPVGQPVYPATTSSGIVGQTGATGIGPIWSTAAVVVDTTAWSAARAYFSGVARVMEMLSVGVEGAGQCDIVLVPQGGGYI